MADAPDGPKSSRTLLLAVAAVVILALLAWQFGLLGGAEPQDTEPTYEAGVTDESGGELIVGEPDPDAVEVELPETPMTPVPVESPSPTPAE